MSVTRLYVVQEEGRVPDRLIEAANPSQAIRHCVYGRFTADAASAQDVARLMAAGVTVEKAGGLTE